MQVCRGGIVGLVGDNVVRNPAGDWWYAHAPGIDEPVLAIKRQISGSDTLTQAQLFMVSDGRSQLLAIGDSIGGLSTSYAGRDFDPGPWGSSGITARQQTFGPRRWNDTTSLGEVSVFRNRSYDPMTGRWLQEDPAGMAGGVNLYQYNGNNPASFRDAPGPRESPPDLCGPGDASRLHP